MSNILFYICQLLVVKETAFSTAMCKNRIFMLLSHLFSLEVQFCFLLINSFLCLESILTLLSTFLIT